MRRLPYIAKDPRAQTDESMRGNVPRHDMFLLRVPHPPIGYENHDGYIVTNEHSELVYCGAKVTPKTRSKTDPKDRA